MPWLLILFVVVPALELYVLIQIGTVIGAMNTFLLILGTGILGSWLAKNQGLATWRALNQRFSQGQIPGKELMDGAIILVCAALLLTPGVITDVIGLAGLIPVTRAGFRNVLSALFTANPAFRVSFGAGSVYNAYRGSTSQQSGPDPSGTPHAGTESPQEASLEDEPIVSGSAKSRPAHMEPTSGV